MECWNKERFFVEEDLAEDCFTVLVQLQLERIVSSLGSQPTSFQSLWLAAISARVLLVDTSSYIICIYSL